MADRSPPGPHRGPTPTPRTPRAARTAVAALLALLVLAGVGAVPSTSVGAQEPAPDLGTATWGTRTSYRAYIVSPVARGTVEATDGATWLEGPGNARGPFAWPVLEIDFDPATTTGVIALGGTVTTAGHDYGNGPILELDWSNLRLEIDGDTGTLVADLAFRPYVSADPNVTPPPRQEVDDVAFGAVDLSGVDWTPGPDGRRTIADAPVTGVLETMELIGWDRFYEVELPDVALDDLSVTFGESDGSGGTTTTTSTTQPGSTTSTPPSTSVAPPPGGDRAATVTGGRLDWGLRQSFRTYVVGPIANGAVTTSGGATVNPDGTYRFPVVTGPEVDVASGRLQVAFTGSVNFTGHGGQLDLTVSDPRIVFDGATGSLHADVTSLPLEETEPEVFDDVRLGALDLSGVAPGLRDGLVVWPDVPVTLTGPGAPAFADFYGPGEQLDPLTVALRLSETPDLPELPTEEPEGDTVALDRTTVRAGEEIGIVGDGFAPGEQVEVWLLSDPVFLQTEVADPSGTVRARVTIPIDTPPGIHHIELRGISSGRTIRSDPFTVLPAADTVPVVAPAGSGPAPAPATTLPRTGSDLDAARLGAVLVLAGAVLVVAARRRAVAAAATGSTPTVGPR